MVFQKIFEVISNIYCEIRFYIKEYRPVLNLLLFSALAIGAAYVVYDASSAEAKLSAAFLFIVLIISMIRTIKQIVK